MGVNNHNQLQENVEYLNTAPELDPMETIISEEILIPSNWKL
jgi:hypothetical protein